MAPVTRFLVLFPLVLALVSFVLSSLTLFAGHKRGFMEDYAVVRLNTSMIGHNLFAKRQDSQPGPQEGLLSDLQGWLNDKKDGVKGKVNDASGRVADRVASKLHLSQWYSLHVMDACEGSFEPDPKAPHAKLKTTNCTVSGPNHRLNLTHLVDGQLNLGPVGLSLADINWPDSLQDKLDILNDALTALFVVYVLAMGCSGLSMLLNLGAFLLPDQGIITLLNLVAASLAGLACTIGSIIVTVAGSKAVKHINQRGERVGISATRGLKFYTIGWIATGFMLAVSFFWLGQFLVLRRGKAALLREKERL